MRKICVVCGTSDNKVVFREFDVDILKCRHCGHVYSSYRVDRYYEGYFGERVEGESQYWWDEAHAKMYDDFCDRFIAGKSGRLLDVGCGLGYFVKKISTYENWRSFGYEISNAAVEFAKKELRLGNVYQGKVEESDFQKDFFDIITLWDVIEHIPEPDPLLKYLCSILKENGILFMHTPNVRIQVPKARIKKLVMGMNPDVHYLEARDHVNLYSMNTMETILRRNGFRTVEFTHLHPIQSVSGSRSRLLSGLKNLYFHFSRGLFKISSGRINIDNLFVLARR